MLREKYDEAVKAKKELKAMIDELCEELCARIEKTPMDGVTKVSDSPRIVTVKFSALGDVWAPEYYIPECQAEAVTTALAKATTNNIVPTVKEMIMKKRARIKGAARQNFWYPAEYVYLNDNTVQIIRDSELGRFALSFEEEKEETEECLTGVTQV